MDSDFKTWLSGCNANNIMWVIEMAKNGVKATEGAGEDQRNVFLYEIETRCREYLEHNDY